jgi:hypothetical protein
VPGGSAALCGMHESVESVVGPDHAHACALSGPTVERPPSRAQSPSDSQTAMVALPLTTSALICQSPGRLPCGSNYCWATCARCLPQSLEVCRLRASGIPSAVSHGHNGANLSPHQSTPAIDASFSVPSPMGPMTCKTDHSPIPSPGRFFATFASSYERQTAQLRSMLYPIEGTFRRVQKPPQTALQRPLRQ